MSRLLSVVAAAALVVAAPVPAAPRAGCGPGDTRHAFRTFVAAFNAGDVATLDALFARKPGFKWYSSGTPGERLDAAAVTRSTLRPYFGWRHRMSDHLAVRWFRFQSEANGLGHFSFLMRRSALDHLRGTPFDVIGKGAVACAGGRFVVLSLSGPRP